MMKLSIVIPVFKVEAFVCQCLESIRAQYVPTDALEVIVIDDGSPDRSVEVIRPLLEVMPYVSLVRQSNQGLSVARNVGLARAQGEYVWFVDSDDWLLPDALERVFGAFAAYPDAEVFATVLEVHEEGKMPHREYEPKPLRSTGKVYLEQGYRQGASQRFVCKRQFLLQHGLAFYPGILHEDGLFGYQMLYWAARLVVLPQPVYAYRIRKQGSIMSSISMKTPTDLLFIHQQLMKFCRTRVAEADRDWYRLKVFSILHDLFFFSRSLVATPAFKEFYRQHERYFRQEALFAMAHRATFGSGVQLRFFPLAYWKGREALKRLIYSFKK